MKGIADTGFLVAFANARDDHHEWAVEIAARVTEPLYTCEAVLAEAAFRLRDTALVLAMVEEGLVTVAFDLARERRHVAALAARYADREPDLANLCLVRLAELHPKLPVITTDRRDFRVYRRNKREIIATICPPER